MELKNVQLYPWNLNLIENLEDEVVFLTINVFNSDIFFFVSFKHDLRKSLLHRIVSKEKKTIQLNKSMGHGCIIHVWSDKAFQVTVVKLALSSLHWGSLEVWFTVPLNWHNSRFFRREKQLYLPQCCSDKGLKDTVVLSSFPYQLC